MRHPLRVPLLFLCVETIASAVVFACSSGSGGNSGSGPSGPDGGEDHIVEVGGEQVTALALGQANCALFASGTVKCWGINWQGVLGLGDSGIDLQYAPTAVQGLNDALQIASGGATCALRKTGQIMCWGDRTGGLIPDGRDDQSTVRTTPVLLDGPTNIKQISVGSHTACALDQGGGVSCWGAFPGTQKQPPTAVAGLSNVAQVAAGDDYACALGGDGSIRCWGVNDHGQCGQAQDSSASVQAPAIVNGLPHAVEVVAGEKHACARSSQGTVLCWGDDGTGSYDATPQTISGITDAVSLSAYGDSTCARKADGTVMCWGQNEAGELGTGDTPTSLANSKSAVVAKGISNAEIVGVGVSSACVVADKTHVSCWGSNRQGLLGGAALVAPAPVRIQGDLQASSVSAGNVGSCIATQYSQQAYCWGGNGRGGLGSGISQTGDTSLEGMRSAPVQLSGLTSVTTVVQGNYFGCALQSQGTVWCWGDNSFGQLGASASMGASTPQAVPKIADAVEIGAGAADTCVRNGTGVVTCWGGVFGAPQVVSGVTAKQLAVGYDFACALLANPGSVSCWGLNDVGQLGNGQTSNGTTAPGNVLNITDAIYIGAGLRHACAVRSSGAVMCWGWNLEGQLGIGQHDGVSHPVPKEVPNTTDVTAVYAGGGGTCVKKSTGQIVCWGESVFSGTGDRFTSTTIDTPGAPVSNLLAERVALGGGHACAITSNGAVECWGKGLEGELGNGSVIYSTFPAEVPGF